MVDFTYRSFYLSQKYRTPVILLGDGLLGQMMEPVKFGEYSYPEISNDDWILSGAAGRKPRWIASIDMEEGALERKAHQLFAKYQQIAEAETTYEELYTDDAELIVTAFGSTARITKSAIKKARTEGLKVGLFRPITLFPFPEKAISDLANTAKVFLDIEMNMGQMLQDVKLAVNGKVPVKFYGRVGGSIPTIEEIYEKILETHKELKNTEKAISSI